MDEPGKLKSALLEAAIAQLEVELETMRRAAQATRDGATHEESRAENDKDTRGLESSYLARGQAERVAELELGIQKLRHLSLESYAGGDRIALTAVVTLDLDGDELRYFLVPAGGGLEIDVDGARIVLVTPSAPLGRALLGKEVGDEIEIRVAGTARTYEVTGIG